MMRREQDRPFARTYLRPIEVVRMTGLSRSAVFAALWSGELEGHKGGNGRAWLIPVEAVDQWIRGAPKASPKEVFKLDAPGEEHEKKQEFAVVTEPTAGDVTNSFANHPSEPPPVVPDFDELRGRLWHLKSDAPSSEWGEGYRHAIRDAVSVVVKFEKQWHVETHERDD